MSKLKAVKLEANFKTILQCTLDSTSLYKRGKIHLNLFNIINDVESIPEITWQ